MPLAEADTQRPVRVVVVDDDFIVRLAVSAMLEPHVDIEVVGAAAGGDEAVEVARRVRPDVVLMDIAMPGMDGVAATRAVLAHVDTGVIAMTSIASIDTVQQMLVAGAYGYVLKDAAPDVLGDAVRTVARGEAFLSPHHTRLMVERIAADSGQAVRTQAAELFASLTERERDAARRVAAGCTDLEIARAMHLAMSTVKTHVQQARIKFGVSNRTQIAVMVERAGQTPDL